jgi:deoxycytidylate deaminase
VDASTIIIGFTGSIGSGCSYISEFIHQVSDESYKYFKLSDAIRNELKEEGIVNPSTEQMQNKGNELRREHGNGALVGLLIDKLVEEDEKSHIIIDGIKNIGEVSTLRQFPYFFLFSVQADFPIRKERVLKVGRFPTAVAFKTADERDSLEKDDINGQQVKKCNYRSDIIILNNDSIANADIGQKKVFVGGIYNKYFKLIENLRNGKPSPTIYPTVDELCMTTAYTQSKMSSCLKRKVGAVVVDTIKNEAQTPIQPGKITQMPSVIATGFNEVPIGSYMCVYQPNVEKCYRDHLQELHAKKLECCPKCGNKLQVVTKCTGCGNTINGFLKYCTTCQREIEDIFKCPTCGCSVFSEYLPGSKETPGKLLDMCRALHAEETALLNLLRNTPAKKENLTLYVTTQPCNLCANKIVSAGIKKVVFDEPYPMKEALDILEAGGVSCQRFEGIKSTAYFKIYN